MSNSARFGIVGLAVALAAAAFLLLRPAEDSRRQSPTASKAPDGEPGDARGESAAPPTAPARPTYERVVLRDGAPVGGVRTVSVESGETVRLAFRSEAAGEVHIHGYDRYLDLKPGRTVRTSFPARLEGVFDVEDHATEEPLVRLRVEP